MADTVYLTTGTNGVSYGLRYTANATDAANLAIVFDFQVDLDLVAVIMVEASTGINVPLADAVITYPAKGQVRLANGTATFVIADGQIINIVAQYARKNV